MPKVIYTSEHTEFLAKHVKGTPFNKLTDLFNAHFGMNASLGSIKSLCRRKKLYNGLAQKFTAEQVEFVKANNQGRTRKDLTTLFNMHFGLTYTEYQIHRLCIWHKIVNGLWKMPIGSKRTHKGWVWVKVAEPNVWRLKHHVVWEEAHGAIPKEHCVVFADGNKENCSLENLILVSNIHNSAMGKRNLYTSNPDLTRLGATRIKLHFKLKELKKHLQNKQEVTHVSGS